VTKTAPALPNVSRTNETSQSVTPPPTNAITR
jgi:hypothetical protein